jgi:hypothetical protein
MPNSACRLVILVAAVSTLACTQARTVSFAGTWTLDTRKSDFDRALPPDSKVLEISHKGTDVRVLMNERAGSSRREHQLNLKTDGQAVRNEMRNTDGDVVQADSRTIWSNGTLVTAYRIDHLGHFDDYHETWDLSADATTLTITRLVTLPNRRGQNRDYSIRMVYSKDAGNIGLASNPITQAR